MIKRVSEPLLINIDNDKIYQTIGQKPLQLTTRLNFNDMSFLFNLKQELITLYQNRELFDELFSKKIKFANINRNYRTGNVIGCTMSFEERF